MGLLVSGLVSAVRLRAQPPAAPVHERRETRHGATVIDNYYWLREKANPETIRYLEAENAYTEAMTAALKPFENGLYAEMLARIKQTDLSVPARRGEYLYYTRTEEGKQYPIQCRRKGAMTAAEEVLLDLNEMASGRKFVGLGAFSLSDDQNLLAYTIDYAGFRQYSLHVKDLRTGQTLPDTAERVTWVEWAADNKTLFLTTEDAVTKRSDKLWRHALGEAAFEPLYEEKDELYDISILKTRDRKFLLLEIGATDTTECRYLRADRPSDQFAVFLPREKKHRYYVDHREGLFYIRTNKNAVNFQVVTAPENNPVPTNWKTFIAHRDDALIAWIDLFENFAVAIEKSEALDHLRIHNFRTGAWTAIEFPEKVYAASPGITPDFESAAYRYNYQSFSTPPSVYDYDAASGNPPF